ncbi:MAG: hypothetical protein Sv326_0868 [Candidatus Fermentimicrarchaeum limneticum]|uniref:Uncharacterized protein n=1 Tax=Fermentimicrarchaeum limneticum TaxID=2795018 RepID=A0A7D6BQT2_FERL1|nr:MAG: hypothetical protein Sv326_0868 [Candidatus Fermentimicrarchaeum limneticum]
MVERLLCEEEAASSKVVSKLLNISPSPFPYVICNSGKFPE